MRHTILAVLTLLAAAPAGAGRFTGEYEATPGMPGFCTCTLTYEASAGQTLGGFDFTATGSINQVNPFGLETIFQDNNVVFPAVGASVEQDSQFLFNSGDVLFIGVEENATLLKGAVSGLASLDLTNPTPFVQVVTDSPYDVEFELAFDNGTGIGEFYSGTLHFNLAGPPACLSVPEPGALLLSLAAFSLTAARGRRR